MIRKLIIVVTLIASQTTFAQTDVEAVQKVANDFVEGTKYRLPDQIENTFYPNVQMFLWNSEDTVLIMSPERYASLYRGSLSGTPNSREWEILTVDVQLDVAYVKLYVDIPPINKRFYDLLLLKKINTEWKIIGKCTSSGPMPSDDYYKPTPQKRTIVEGLKRPWSMAFLNENEVIIAEKDGGLLNVNLQSKETQTITGLPKDIAQAVLVDTSKFEEGVFFKGSHGTTGNFNAGLFQVLLDPNFSDNHFLYLSYAAENDLQQSAVKIIRAKLHENALIETETIFNSSPYSHGLYHYGGGMIFGADGKLYVTLGERNLFEYNNPTLPLSQDLTEVRGKVLRINSDGSIPSDNPNFGPNAAKGLFASGIRASQGLAIDPGTDKLWFTDHGTLQGDEINLLESGANYGWPYSTTGKFRTSDYKPKMPEGLALTDPIFSWDHTVAPTGLTFYTGNEFPTWQGSLIVPGLSKGSLWRFQIKDDKIISSEELLLNDRVRIRKAIMSPRGKLYLLTDEVDGKLILINSMD